VRIKQLAVTEFFPGEGDSPLEFHCLMQFVYGDDRPWNIITKVHWRDKGIKTKTQAWAGRVIATAFFGTQVVLFTRISINLGSPSTQRYIATLKTLKQRLRIVRLHKNILLEHDNARSLSPRDPPRRQLKSWLCISPSYHTCHTVQTWRHATCTFFQKMNEDLRRHLCDSNEEVESTLWSRTKKQSVDLFRDDFEKPARRWRKCAEYGGD
jgi:hypothetical protein